MFCKRPILREVYFKFLNDVDWAISFSFWYVLKHVTVIYHFFNYLLLNETYHTKPVPISQKLSQCQTLAKNAEFLWLIKVIKHDVYKCVHWNIFLLIRDWLVLAMSLFFSEFLHEWNFSWIKWQFKCKWITCNVLLLFCSSTSNLNHKKAD